VSAPARKQVELPGFAELAVDASPGGIVVCDEDGTILLANRRLATMFGYTVSELIGISIDVLVPAASRGAHDLERTRFWGRPETRAMGAGRELFGCRRDGTQVPVEVALTVTMRDGRRLVIGSVVDITERLKQEQFRQARAAERIGFERLVARLATRFVNIASDEVDATIVDSLRQIAEALELDRGTVWQFTDAGDDLVYTHVWVRPECPAPPPRVSTREVFPWFLSRVRTNEAVWSATVDDVPDSIDRENLRRFGTKSNAVIPLSVDGSIVGALSLGALRAERSWSADVREKLALVATVFAHALARERSQRQLEKALADIERLRQQLAQENVHLREEVRAMAGPRAIAGESAAVRAVLAQIESVAPTHATVLLLGETGTGKEVFAQAIHEMSPRRNRPMVRVNCAAIPSALIENELFGRERGAYTGALSRQIGRFELAEGATLFLDEVGDLPLESQVKLLRAIEYRVVERLGGTRPIHVDVRLIAATNRDLEAAVTERAFREDLYYRLNVFPIRVPPLRDRVDDIPALVWSFIEEFAKTSGKRIESISRESLAALQRYAWPGNVRELRNLVERAVILSRGPCLVFDVPDRATGPQVATSTLAGVEAEHIRGVLERAGWRVRGPGGAAELLGMRPTTLDSRMAKLGIRRPTA
jgi:PAS domain S-box-containing protein